jgi:serine/threonine-protein phosphatase 6 regulatory subunit 3
MQWRMFPAETGLLLADHECSAQQNGLRLGYMGHLILISDDIVAALEHYPHSLLEALTPYVPQPDWDSFVAGQYKETKERDLSQLGGGKPAISATGAGIGRGASIGNLATNRFGDTPSPRMESTVGRGVGPAPREVRGGADFGPAELDDTLTPSEPDQVNSIASPVQRNVDYNWFKVSRFISEPVHSSQFESGSLSDDDDDIDPAWISTHSASGDFDLNAAHTAASRNTRDPFEVRASRPLVYYQTIIRTPGTSYICITVFYDL